MISMIRAVGICCSFHLKMSVPFGLRTRIHSSNPCRMSSSHEGRRRPYFFASHDDSPRLFRCGGSYPFFVAWGELLTVLRVPIQSEMIVFLDNAAGKGFCYPIHESVDLLYMGRDRSFDNAIPVLVFPIAVRAIMMTAYRMPILLGCFFFRCAAVIPCTIIIAIDEGISATVARNAV